MPSGAHWFWTRVIPEIAKRLEPSEELHLLVSPQSRDHFQGFGPNVRYITYPFSNERRSLRALSEHAYSPLRLPLNRIDVFNTLMAPVWNVSWAVVIHMKTMHAYTTPDAVSPAVRAYRRMTYPRSARIADAIIINSESLRSAINNHLDVDPRKFRLIYEAVDHDLFKPGDSDTARAQVAGFGIHKRFALFVSSLWPYKNCEALLHAWALVREQLGGRQLAIVGAAHDEKYSAGLRELATQLGMRRKTSSSSAAFPWKRRLASTKPRMCSSIPLSRRRSGSRSSRRWPAAALWSPRTRAPCLRSRVRPRFFSIPASPLP